MSDDNGSVSALASGFQMGMQGLNARRSHEMSLQHLALAQQAAQMRMQQMQQQAQMQQQGMQLRQQSQDLRNQQALDKQQQTQADQTANTALFDSLDQQADPRQTGPFDDQHPPATMGGKLGMDRDAFSQASPQVQTSMLAPTLQGQRDLQRLTASSDLKRQADELKRSKIHTAIAASSLPDDVKEKLHLKTDGAAGVPMGDTLSPQEWQGLPYRQQLGQSAPEVSQLADAYVAATGKFPTQIVMQHMQQMHTAANPQAQMRLQADMAHRSYLESAREHTDARTTLNAFRKQNADALTPPSDKPATDPAWATYNAAKQQEKPLKAAADEAKKRRDEAFKASQQAKDQALGLSAPPPAARATGQAKQATAGADRPPMQSAQNPAPAAGDAESAATQAWKELGPTADPKAVHKRATELLNQTQPAPLNAGPLTDPYDDQRADPTDDGDDDTTPDDDEDDQEF